MQAMVEAVPITMQVPEVGISWSWARSRSGPSSEPARNAAHSRRQSVQAPSRAPSCLPASIEPTEITIAGMSALIAPISSAGMVLSQPPISTTASSGSAPIISSTSMAMRLRSSIEVGNANASCSETVGNTNGSAPAMRTPRDTASATWGAVLWQGLKSDAVDRMPTIGRSSASSVKPAPLRKPRRRNSANSSSPYLARRDRRPFFIELSPSLEATPMASAPLLKVGAAGVNPQKKVARPEGTAGRAERIGAGKGVHADR